MGKKVFSVWVLEAIAFFRWLIVYSGSNVDYSYQKQRNNIINEHQQKSAFNIMNRRLQHSALRS